MEEEERMAEKYDLSLDNRQIVSGLIAVVIILGTVFVLGVVVGKKMATDQRSSRAPDLLTALDEKAAQIDLVRKEQPPLTFPDILTKNAPVAVSSNLKAPPPPTADTAKPSSADPAPEVKVEQSSVHSRTVAKTVPPTDTPAVKKAVGTSAKDLFTLQLSSSQNRSDADRLVTRLRGKGYSAHVVQAEVPGRGIWYRVRLGSFGSKGAAAKYLGDFKRETRLNAFVTSLN